MSEQRVNSVPVFQRIRAVVEAQSAATGEACWTKHGGVHVGQPHKC